MLEVDQSGLLVDLADGQRLRAVGSAAQGQRVELCIRAESVDLEPKSDGPAPDSSLVGRIASRAYLGNAIDYDCPPNSL